MLPTMLSDGTAQNGSRQAVVGSGTINRSLSLIDFQPRIDEPSNPEPSLNSPSLSSSTGIEKCCQVPSRSTNFKSTTWTLFFFANSNTSRGFIPNNPPCHARYIMMGILSRRVPMQQPVGP